jgi:hypothetical protein
MMLSKKRIAAEKRDAEKKADAGSPNVPTMSYNN